MIDTKPKPAKPDETAILVRNRVRQTQLRMLDVADATLAELAPPALPVAPVAVARRQLANTLGLWNFCANKKCRRTKCCRGEPLDCLRSAMPLLTAEHVAAILPKPGRPNRSRRRDAAVALPADQVSRAVP